MSINLADKPVRIIEDGTVGHCTWQSEDGEFVRVTPILGDPISSLSLRSEDVELIRDWIGDSEQYENDCFGCEQNFKGYKRRVFCAICDEDVT